MEPVLLKKFFNVWFDEIQVVDRKPFSLAELARYPLFSPDFLDFLRGVVPPHRHHELVYSVVVTARKPKELGRPMRCAACGHENALGARFCNQCGTSLHEEPVPSPHQGGESALYEVHALLDTGAGGCEEGVLLKLRVLIGTLDLGQVLEVRSTDPGVREDLPAWCRIAGHEYLGSRGARYFVRKS
ncbi:MAG: sulfurtransferase TusA family protein [Anaerolineae bacterium]